MEEFVDVSNGLQQRASIQLHEQGIDLPAQVHSWEADVRYFGQATSLSVEFTVIEISEQGLQILDKRYD